MRKVFSFLILLFSISTFAQTSPTQSLNSSEIKQALNKLEVLGNVLYIAAHPDDENTRLISYLSKYQGLNVAYLSLTRGDGGQNLVGKEVREQLGIIRTQELLAARKIDGGKQFFSRANDFGYSKHPDETFNIWDKEQVLADAVWTIRKFKPDVIITRFSPDRAGKTHGHHTASAVIAEEAFIAAADPKMFPEQLKFVDTWQTTRILWNTSYWFYRGRENELDTSKLIVIDAGKYNPLLGKSMGEVASISRTNHKSQGFGSSLHRGSRIEYLEPLEGDKGKTDHLFSEMDISWNRIKGGKKIAEKLQKINQDFDFEKPEKSISALVDLYQNIKELPDNQWLKAKKKELENIILQCAGIWMDATNPSYRIAAGDSLNISTRIINRSKEKIFVDAVEVVFNGSSNKIEKIASEGFSTKFNEYVTTKINVQTPENLSNSNPYWLNEKGTKGMFRVDDQTLIGLPENAPSVSVVYTIHIGGIHFETSTPVLYRSTDPVKGELYRPLEIAPPVTANLTSSVFLFADDNPQEIQVLVKCNTNKAKGRISLLCAGNWKIEPAQIDYNFDEKFAEKTLKFKIYPPKNQSVEMMQVAIQANGKTYNQSLKSIQYDHLPTQTLYPVAETKLVKVDLKKRGEKIGYIMGAGDAIPEALRQIGYRVDLLEDEDIKLENLKQYDAIIAGIRVYNTNERMRFYYDDLMAYVKQGGNYIVQYNTAHRLKTKDFGPYPIKLSRDRVTVEEAPVRILEPKHRVLNEPNKITQKDFEGWAQERGLYFPNEWDENYTALFSMNDPGETAKKGSLLICDYGEGAFIYSGISWFRELPPGVPGAYRLFVNLISYDKNK